MLNQKFLFHRYRFLFWSLDSSVGTAIGYGLDNQGIGVQFPARARHLSLLYNGKTVFGVLPAFCSVGTGALSPDVKRQGPEAGHPLPSSSEFKNEWSYASVPSYIFMVWCLIRHKDDVTFLNCNSHSKSKPVHYMF
jgi:hypothetical protein